MKGKRLMVIGSAAAILALVAGSALAGPGGFGGGWGCGLGPVIGQTLTPEQAAQLQKLRQEHESRLAPLRQELWTKKAEWRGLIADGNPDPAKAVALQREMLEISDEMHREMIEMRTKMLDLVSPPQGN